MTPLPEAGGELGPAMSLLTPLRRAFVIGLVHFGLSARAAYKAAGYAPPDSNVSQISHDPRVQDAILEEAKKLMRTHGPKSILTLVEIRDDKESAAKDRIKAATELLNRSGFQAISEHHEHLHRHLSDTEQDRRILALCAELGLSPEEAQKMLIAPAEFERNAAGVFEMPAEPPEPPSANALAIRASRTRHAGKTGADLEASKRAVQAERAEQMSRERLASDAAREVPAPPEMDGITDLEIEEESY
jgi:hypothetical protein